jgi:hypothetical protein
MTAEITRRVAYCHPESVSINANWLKNLVLFFDEICILLPDLYRDEFFTRLDWLVTPLINEGILHLLRPEDVVDEAVSDSMARAGNALIDIGFFQAQQGHTVDNLALPSTDKYVSRLLEAYAASTKQDILDIRVVNSRLQRQVRISEPRRTESLIERLTDRHLLRPSGREGESLADPFVRACLLALLPLIIRHHAAAPLLAEITPVTNQKAVFDALGRVIDLPPFHRVGEVVQTDLNAIGINTESVPIGDMIAFRTDHRDAYSRYLQTAEDIARDLTKCSPDERSVVLRDREQRVEDELHELRKITRQWGRPMAGVSIALSGAVWSAVHGGDPVGGALAGLGALVGFTGPDRREAKLNYLFQVQSSYGSPIGLHKSVAYKKQKPSGSNKRGAKKGRKRK